jgi:site-specific DNA-methyltransferase (cytosine-N4-specific)
VAGAATRLSRIHPYPAMVADELAISLAARFVPSKARVLDPFCGSGRLLAAAKQASLRVGCDANPLAWLLTRAKFAKVQPGKIAFILSELEFARTRHFCPNDLLDTGRKVAWFAPRVHSELSRIVHWLNGLQLTTSETMLVAAALSATVRDVSFARDQGWKLHRLSADARRSFRPCAWDQFKKRLTYCLAEITSERLPSKGRTVVSIADIAEDCQRGVARLGPFDVVLTSPPYGDSRSTVQYGAASSLCLSIVSGLNGLSHLKVRGGAIDRSCLGGAESSHPACFAVKPYWAGSSRNSVAKSVSRFLSDYDAACGAIARHLKPDGTAVFVVGRRSTGGYRLKLDKFTIDCFLKRGFALVCKEERKLQHKRTPRLINRFGRDQERQKLPSALVPTMNSEIIVVMRRQK